MKVLLIDPGKRYLEKEKNVVKPYPHIGLVYLASYLLQNDVQVQMMDVGANDIDDNKFTEILLGYQPDIIGITAMTFSILEVYRISKLIKKISPEFYVILGGAHGSSVPEQVLEETPEIDLVVRGEGEITLHQIVQACESGQLASRLPEIKGITYRNGNKIISNPAQEWIYDLDQLPFPDWSLVDYSKYFKLYSDKYKEEISMYQISGSRGCPYSCIFCFPLLGRPFRFRSPESVVTEMEWIHNQFGAKHIDFTDSTTTVDRERFLRLCDLIIEKGLHEKLQWIFETRANLVDSEILRKAKAAGSELVYYGLESGDDYILDKMNKQITTEMAEKAVQMAVEVGLKVKVSFILGHPYETVASANRTFEFAKKLKRLYGIDMYFNLIDIYPGTELFNAVDQGIGGLKWIKGNRNNWTRYLRSAPMIEVNDLNANTALELYDKFVTGISEIKSTYSYQLQEEMAK